MTSEELLSDVLMRLWVCGDVHPFVVSSRRGRVRELFKKSSKSIHVGIILLCNHLKSPPLNTMTLGIAFPHLKFFGKGVHKHLLANKYFIPSMSLYLIPIFFLDHLLFLSFFGKLE